MTCLKQPHFFTILRLLVYPFNMGNEDCSSCVAKLRENGILEGSFDHFPAAIFFGKEECVEECLKGTPAINDFFFCDEGEEENPLIITIKQKNMQSMQLLLNDPRMKVRNIEKS